MSLRKTLLASAILALISFNWAYAVNYKTSYLSFDLPPSWSCVAEGTEYVCSSGLQKGKRDAVIVFTAKERGPSDSFSAYEQHLKTPRTIPNDKNQMTQSKIIKVVRNTINGQEWVDGLHDNSEVFNYFTRYLATVKEQLGILITFSAHRKSYSRYSQDFDRAIRSLVVLKIPTAAPNIPVTSTTNTVPTFPSNLPQISPPPEPEAIGSGGEGGSSMSTTLGIALLFLAIIGYLVLRRKDN
ncbi:MAG: hypothetical protein A4S09_07570 [Proteobacteria bacterium SG_bin7]|nr:MAG: hypothetical protein A4S09_07570 [Proteobacteria bacterium SG_bin7]